MLRSLRFLFALLLLAGTARADGVAVVDAVEGRYLRLSESHVRVQVENQVARVTAVHVFRNDGGITDVKYAFPLPEGASATRLRWHTGGAWREAAFTAAPQDTTLPGGGGGASLDPALLDYLGDKPLYFALDEPVAAESELTVELTYVQLLPYSFGDVDFVYPHDYTRIQRTPLALQTLDFELTSLRTITVVDLLSHDPVELTNDGTVAHVAARIAESPADRDYHVRYRQRLDELGLFGFSTMLPDTARIDDEGGGYFVFVAEPDPSESAEVLDKVFTLIVDRSGSMSGDKIVQARNAARFVVEHLNEGDRFNIISFNDQISTFRNEHVPFNEANRAAALAYIDDLRAGGWTNISGAFGTAVPQFAGAGTETANIIVFFTDGIATTGITNREGILAHVQDLVEQHETPVTVFNFGVGPDVDRQLLTLLATQNDGLAEYLGEDELEARITDFYLRIRNPVLLGTEVSFSPAVVSETFPDPLPSLYKGQQMIVAGRYSEAVPVTVTLRGEAFGRPVSYSYPLTLEEGAAEKYQFLPKIWAKLKIEGLLVRYYSLNPYSAEAEGLREEIVGLSLAYGVISPFTSFSPDDPDDPDGPSTGVEEGEVVDEGEVPVDFELLGNYPNPFNPTTTIRFRVGRPVHETVTVRIYDTLGRLVRVLAVNVSDAGVYEVTWDGRTASGEAVPSGTYVYVVSFEDAVLGGTMTLVK